MTNLYSELTYIESLISNTCDAMTCEELTEARRRELSLKLDNLNSKRDYIQSKIDILEGEAESEPSHSKDNDILRIMCLSIYGIVLLMVLYITSL